MSDTHFGELRCLAEHLDFAVMLQRCTLPLSDRDKSQNYQYWIISNFDQICVTKFWGFWCLSVCVKCFNVCLTEKEIFNKKKSKFLFDQMNFCLTDIHLVVTCVRSKVNVSLFIVENLSPQCAKLKKNLKNNKWHLR